MFLDTAQSCKFDRSLELTTCRRLGDCGTYAPLSTKNLACKSILCRFALCGGGGTAFHPLQNLERPPLNEACFSDLGWDWCCVFTRIDARTSLCEGLSHILTYQAGGSSGRYRVNETRTHHIVENRRQGCSRCMFSARINRWVGLLPVF